MFHLQDTHTHTHIINTLKALFLHGMREGDMEWKCHVDKRRI